MQNTVYKDSPSHKEIFLGDTELPVPKRIRFDPFVGEEWFLRGERETRWKDARVYEAQKEKTCLQLEQ